MDEIPLSNHDRRLSSKVLAGDLADPSFSLASVVARYIFAQKSKGSIHLFTIVRTLVLKMCNDRENRGMSG